MKGVAMRKIALAILLALAITVGPSEATLAQQLDTSEAPSTVRQTTITIEAPIFDDDDLGNQPLSSDDNHDNG
jgi:hypothetical protein